MDILEIEEAIRKVGGRFKLTVLINKRIRELIRGYRPLVKIDSTNPMEIAFREILEGKIALVDTQQSVEGLDKVFTPLPQVKGKKKKESKK